MTTVNVQMTGERLAAMSDNDMAVYHTPGASNVYWASGPSFMYDTCVATVKDFLTEAGYDELDESLSDEIFDLDIEIDND
jgi:hypothetical protein